eukprot:211075-Rhodomonas_salina.1
MIANVGRASLHDPGGVRRAAPRAGVGGEKLRSDCSELGGRGHPGTVLRTFSAMHCRMPRRILLLRFSVSMVYGLVGPPARKRCTPMHARTSPTNRLLRKCGQWG